jgi:molybdate transport system substrate-binding protein
MRLEILSGGATQGLVAALGPQFKAETGCDVGGSFGAVGAMRDRLLAGAAADVLILTSALIAELASCGGRLGCRHRRGADRDCRA